MRRLIRLLLASPVLMIGAITSFAQTAPAPATAPATTVQSQRRLTPEQQAKIPAIVAAEKVKWEAVRQKRQSRQAAPQ
jgi:hypothetical protein